MTRTAPDQTGLAPRDMQWQVWDDDTYDGAPDSPTRHEIGFGATEGEAVADLMEKMT